MKKKRKKKRRLRVDRVLLVLFILVLFIFLLKFIPYVFYNQKIYKKIDSSKNNIVEIDKKYNKLKLYNKTINLIKKKNITLIIKDKKYKITLQASEIKKNMKININTYNKRINYEGFSKNKSYFIDSSLLKKVKNIEITLPRYLIKNKIVDIYAVVNDKKIETIKKGYKVKNNNISIDLDKKYTKYFITYVKLKDIKVRDITVNKGSKVNLALEYIPKNATIKNYEYIKLGEIFMLNENNEVIAKKTGNGKITIRHTVSNIQKTINVKVTNNKIKKIDGITYVDDIFIVNKTYSLPKDYDPGKLNDDALNAFYDMREDASKDDITLWIASGYRSYNTQNDLYNSYVEKDGQKKADTYSARAGYSEHQTGLAMDLNIVDSSFEGTKEAIWIEKNCYKYGFIIRYPKEKEDITGYKYEPWHIRYLGKKLAKKIYDSGLTLEEYLSIDSKYSN